MPTYLNYIKNNDVFKRVDRNVKNIIKHVTALASQLIYLPLIQEETYWVIALNSGNVICCK